MEPQEACSYPDLEWEGPRSVVISRGETGFGFTLRHFVVYPPQSVLDDSRSELDGGDNQGGGRPDLGRELSIEPQDTIFVKSVKEESPAQLAGLQTGDRIIAVNGNSISGKTYREVIAAIHQSSPTLKLLVVPKDEDILQMAYQSFSTESYGPGATSSPVPSQGHTGGLLRSQHQHHCHSSGDLLQEVEHYGQQGLYGSSPVSESDRQEVRHSYPLSHWDSPPSLERRFPVQSQSSGQYRREPLSQSRENWQQYYSEERGYPASYSQDLYDSDMAYNIPTKAKYSFGLYFPPKAGGANNGNLPSGRTISAESLGKPYEASSDSTTMPKSQTFDVGPQRGHSGLSQRKSSLDESSALTSSARSRDYFIRYSSDRAANDLRNRYSSRQPSYKSQPTYIIPRSQTVSTMSPSKSTSTSTSSTTFRHSAELLKSRLGEEDSARSARYIPIVSSSKHSGSSENIDLKLNSQKSQAYAEPVDPSGSRTFVVRIPFDRQQQSQQQMGSRLVDSSGIPMRQNYGTTFALTRSPNAAHIEIQKSIGKPIVSQRKNQFETGKNENTPPLGTAGYNRYKTEIEKIRTQPKFSSIAMRRASFEQSPEKEPSGSCSDDSHRSREQTPSDYGKTVTDTAQPTVKVRKISADHYKSSTGGPHEGSDQAPIRIYVSPGASHDSSSPIVEIVPVFSSSDAMKRSSGGHVESGGIQRLDTAKVLSSKGAYHSPSPSSCSGSSASGGGGPDSTGMVDSGVWIKSYHSSLDMLDGVGGDEEGVNTGSGDATSVYLGERPGVRGSLDLDGRSRPARKTSYLSAVNAPHSRGAPYQQTEPPSAIESRAGYMQTPQQAITKSQALPYPSSQVTSSLQPAPALSVSPVPSSASSSSQQGEQLYRTGFQGSSHSLNALSTVGVPVASVAPTVMTTSDSLILPGHLAPEGLPSSHISFHNDPVTLRKKLPESLEDQANKLHRRTSYLMATARDRANTVPIEQAFSPPQPIMEVPPEEPVPVHRCSSAKLNKFFGETIPEGVEFKANDMEEVPEIIRKGVLSCKISVMEGKKCSDRSWKPVYAVLKQNEMFLTKDKDNAVSSSSTFEDQHIPLRACLVECAREYAKKKKHVFRLTSHQECEYLFQTEDKGTMLCWIQAIKSINEPEKAEQMEPMIASEQAKHAPVPVELSSSAPSKTSPQLGSHKGRKLSALSLKTKLATSPSMRRKKSSAGEKDKSEDHLKKSWKGRIPMMKSLKKSSEDSQAMAKPDSDTLQFGVHLEDCFPSPNNEYVPLIVELCTSIVEARGLEVVGVYRVPGNSAAVNALTDEFNRGIENVNIHNEKLLDINVISSLLKSFFRKLPEPLVPSESYEAFIQANRCPDESKRKLKLKRLLYMLPVHHNETFKHMAEHLNKVASYGNLNKMDAKNLALMFGPTLVKKKVVDTDSLVHDMSDQCCIVESIILHHDWFFSAWDQDNYIPTETKVEPVVVEDSHTEKDDDDEAELAISTKEIISSIVNAASKKLKVQKEKTTGESLDMTDCSASTTSVSTDYKERGSDESTLMSFKTKSLSSIASSRSASEEFLESKSSTPTNRYSDAHGPAPIASSESDFMDLEFADASASSPLSSKFSHHYSTDSMMEKNDELEISHGLPTSVIHNRLKRINNDVNVVSALLQSIEQEHMKERERWRREQELLEREQQRTQLELEEEESIEDLLAWKATGPTASRMPDLVSSSYVGESFDHGRPLSGMSDRKRLIEQGGYVLHPPERKGGRGSVPQVLVTSAVSPTASQEETITQTRSQIQEAMRSSGSTLGAGQRAGPWDKGDQNTQHLSVLAGSRPASLRHSFTRRHGSLDSLIDLIDKEKRSSWASSDSEDGSDLLTSITTTFDQKLQILLNPKYKLTGARKAGSKAESRSDPDPNRMSSMSRASLQSSYTASALVDPNDSFKDPSLHRSSRSDPKIGIASRFERVTDTNRASSSSPVTVGNVQFELGPAILQQHRKPLLPDFKSFLGRGQTSVREANPVVLTQPKKLDSGSVKMKNSGKSENSRPISKSEKTERNSNIVRRSREESTLLGQRKPGESNNQVSVIPSNCKKNSHRAGSRRHTVGGTEDLEHVSALAQICAGQPSASSGDRQELRQSAWEQLQPVVKDSGSRPDRTMQDWIQRERLRGSTPDLTGQD